MHTFRTFLAELANRPYPFTWTYDSDDAKAAVFITQGSRPVKFIVNFEWQPFTPRDLRAGESSGVPKEILEDMVKKHQPGLIGFTAKETSRVKLYQRFVQQVPRYLPGYVGSGPMPQETWRRWMMNYVGPSPFFLLHRKP